MKKILITGGHVTPALAVIEELRKNKEIEIIFVGRKYALDFEKAVSFEYQEISQLRIRFVNLRAGRLTRVLSARSLINFLRFPFGFYNAFKILKKERPEVILSFGGYIALPIAISGYFLKIPVYTHEQTIVPGLANKIIALLAKKVFISFPETKKFFKEEKTIVTGNPLRKSIFKIIKKPFIFPKNKPVIYITGGSLGSHSINILVEVILEKLLAKYIVIHQTGETQEYQDFERLSKIKSQYYFIAKHFYNDEIGFVYSLADLIISRAGANTIFELIALKKPAILIPLPWSAGKEQKIQARFLQEKGVAELFHQGEGNLSDRLYQLIIKMIDNKEKYQRNFNHLTHYYKQNAAKTIISWIIPKV